MGLSLLLMAFFLLLCLPWLNFMYFYCRNGSLGSVRDMNREGKGTDVLRQQSGEDVRPSLSDLVLQVGYVLLADSRNVGH